MTTIYDPRRRFAALKNPEGALRRDLAEVGLKLRKAKTGYAIEDTRGNITPYSLTFDQAFEVRYWRATRATPAQRLPGPVEVEGVTLWPQYECSYSRRYWVPEGHDIDLALRARTHDEPVADWVSPARADLPCQMAGCRRTAAVDLAVHCGSRGSRYIALCDGHWAGPATLTVIAGRVWRENGVQA